MWAALHSIYRATVSRIEMPMPFHQISTTIKMFQLPLGTGRPDIQVCPGPMCLQAVFVSQLWQSNITSGHERREAALQLWEESNRAMLIGKLKAMVEAKERLLHLLSHELRTPVLGIQCGSS